MSSKKLWAFLSAALLLLSCGGPIDIPDPQPEPVPVPVPVTPDEFSVRPISDMTLREKVGQMFIIRPESLEGISGGKVSMDAKMRKAFGTYPVGGFALFAQNIETPYQTRNFVLDLHSLADYPLICIDEEGGTVARIGRNTHFNVTTFTSMYDVGSTGDVNNALNAGKTIGTYLLDYGFDIDFAPVADVFTNPENTVIGKRSFSSDPEIAAMMVSSFLKGLRGEKVEGCLKHFPGHGDTRADTHYGYAETTKTWEEMLACEMLPFRKGIEAGTRLIMTAHIGTPGITGDGLPASLSPAIITDKLRGELKYQGIVITDAIEMGAITNQFSVAEATVRAIEAGVDIVLMPSDLNEAFTAVLDAVASGRITEKRIDESVTKIIQLKRDILTSRGQYATTQEE